MLDLGDAFANVTKHLTSKDCQSLRHTCQLLRHNPAVVEGISFVKDASQYQEGLHQLRSLSSLRLAHPTSVFNLHNLNGLTRLTKVVIAYASVLDLRPLHVIAALRCLELEKVEHYASLPCLQQLDSLVLQRTVATPAVMQISALTQLGLGKGSQVSRLTQLSQLEALRIITYAPDLSASQWEAGSWSANERAALSDALAALPSLCSLSCSSMLLPSLSGAKQLRDLLLFCGDEEVPAHLQDLRQLTSLVKLGLYEYIGQPYLQSASLTALFCMGLWGPGEVSIPHLADCSRLAQIMLSPDDADLKVELGQLPPSAKTIWVGQTGGKLFLESRAAEVVRMRRVKDVWWGSDLEALGAEYI